MHSVSGTYTKQTFGHPNCNMFFGMCFFFPWSTGHWLFSPFQVISSHMAPSLDKHFPWQCQHEFPFTCVFVIQRVCVPSQVRWFPVVHTVIRPLYTICHAMNRRWRRDSIVLQIDGKGFVSLSHFHIKQMEHTRAAYLCDKYMTRFIIIYQRFEMHTVN